MTESQQVLVVGAGPAGLSTAAALAQKGHRVTIAERAEEHRRHSRALIVHARTLEHLDSLGVAQQLVDLGNPCARLSFGRGERSLMEFDFTGVDSRFPFALLISQETTEQVLEQRCCELGVELQRGSTVTGMLPEAAGVTLTGGRELRCTQLVGADGLGSTLRRAAGIAFPGSSSPAHFVLADVRLSGGPDHDRLTGQLADDGVCITGGLPDGSLRVIASVAREVEPDQRLIQQIMDTRIPQRARIEEVLWASRFGVQHRLAERFGDGRLNLVGDAAHVHSPVGGQGMNLGIRDGIELAQALHTGPAQVELWRTRRRREARSVVRTTERIARIGTSNAPAARALLALAMSGVGRLPSLRNRMVAAAAGTR